MEITTESKMKFICTNLQQLLEEEFLNKVLNESIFNLDKAAEANNAVVKLPYLNADGEGVQYGANKIMWDIMDHYLAIARSWYRISLSLDREIEEKIRIHAKSLGLKL
jgi:hypothetical protein